MLSAINSKLHFIDCIALNTASIGARSMQSSASTLNVANLLLIKKTIKHALMVICSRWLLASTSVVVVKNI